MRKAGVKDYSHWLKEESEPQYCFSKSELEALLKETFDAGREYQTDYNLHRNDVMTVKNRYEYIQSLDLK
jgi:hypothetical protein